MYTIICGLWTPGDVWVDTAQARVQPLVTLPNTTTFCCIAGHSNHTHPSASLHVQLVYPLSHQLCSSTTVTLSLSLSLLLSPTHALTLSFSLSLSLTKLCLTLIRTNTHCSVTGHLHTIPRHAHTHDTPTSTSTFHDMDMHTLHKKAAPNVCLRFIHPLHAYVSHTPRMHALLSRLSSA
jgi:hypothetical protein